MNLKNCYFVPFGAGRGEERIGEEVNAINVENGRGGPDVGDADFVLERRGRHSRGCLI
jgi:hypothetical protein